ncbi:hypothetical protein WN943_007376 [Citrus x changshan-huyou]
MGSSLLFPATSVTGVCWSRVQVKVPRFCVRASLDTNVSDMSVNGKFLFFLFYLISPKCLFPPEPEHYRGPKLKVAIIGAGLAGMSTAGELLDQGHEKIPPPPPPPFQVDIYESRSFIGGKVGSFIDKHGNHIEMGLHIFFGCYNNLFRLMKKVKLALLWIMQTYDKARNALALALSPVVRALVDPDGALKDVGDLDSISFSDWFLSKGGTRTSIQRMWDPVAYALLRMLKGSPDNRFHLRWGCREILYDKSANGETYVKGLAMSKATDKKVVQAEAYVTACDVPGIKRLLPSSWREMKFFNNIYELVGVPVVTVQLRYNGWVTELQDLERSRSGTHFTRRLLQRSFAIISFILCHGIWLTSFCQVSLYSVLLTITELSFRCVLTPGDTYMPLPNDEIIRRVAKQVLALFPLSQGLEVIWSFVVKIGQFLYHEGPGKDPFRPDQKTQVKNLFLAGSYTKQDYIDIMEGASLSGRQASAYICNAREELVALRKQLAAFESQEQMEVPTTTNDDLSLV